MNRVLLILLLACAGLVSCRKGYDEVGQIRDQAAKDEQIITNYIATNNLTTAKRIDTTGVFYIVESPGAGNDLFTQSTRVTVDYVGKILTNGKVFTQSNNFHPYFTLGETIRGWQVGLPQIKKGGKVRLLLPSRYAYGPFDQPDIGLPANTVVDFEIELLDVTN